MGWWVKGGECKLQCKVGAFAAGSLKDRSHSACSLVSPPALTWNSSLHNASATPATGHHYDYKWKLLVGLGSIAYYCPENKKPDKLHTHFWDDDDDAAADDDERVVMMMMMMMMMPRCLLKGMLHLLPVCLFKGGLSWKLRARREFVVGQTNQQFQDNTFRAATDSLPRIHSKAAADE